MSLFALYKLRSRAKKHGLKIISSNSGYFLYNPKDPTEIFNTPTDDATIIFGVLDIVDAQSKKGYR